MIKEWRTGLEVLHSDDDDGYYYYLCLNLLFILSLVTQVLLVTKGSRIGVATRMATSGVTRRCSKWADS